MLLVFSLFLHYVNMRGLNKSFEFWSYDDPYQIFLMNPIDNVYFFVPEMLYYLSLYEEDSFLAFYPQVHIKLSKSLQIQLGPGLFFGQKEFIPQLVHRTVYSPQHVFGWNTTYIWHQISLSSYSGDLNTGPMNNWSNLLYLDDVTYKCSLEKTLRCQ